MKENKDCHNSKARFDAPFVFAIDPATSVVAARIRRTIHRLNMNKPFQPLILLCLLGASRTLLLALDYLLLLPMYCRSHMPCDVIRVLPPVIIREAPSLTVILREASRRFSNESHRVHHNLLGKSFHIPILQLRW